MKEKNHFLCLIFFNCNVIFAQVCFNPAVNYNAQQSPVSVAHADFNNDGKDDIVATNLASNTISVFLGSGTGTLGSATNFTVGSGPSSVSAADFNKDGKADLAVTNQFSNNISILLGNGLGGFNTPANITAGSAPYFVITDDFNSDSNADIAVANFSSSDISVLLGNGLGGFGSATNYSVTASSNPVALTKNDFNLDGAIDLVASVAGASSIYTLLGSGTGTFTPMPIIYLTGESPRGIVSGDYNGDGKPDIAIADAVYDSLSLFFGSGNGGFGSEIFLPVGNYSKGVTSADFNNDGKADFAVAGGINSVWVLLGTGAGSFAPYLTFTTGNSPMSLLTSDFNNDSKSDLAVANGSTNNVSILLNCSASGIAQPTYQSIHQVYPNPVKNYLALQGEQELGSFSLLNNLGQPVYQNTTTQKHFQIDLSEYKAGQYVLKFQNEIFKVIKE